MAGDHSEFAAFARRVLRAMARRYATADVEDLAELRAIRGEVDVAIDAAVAGLRQSGFSWAEIADGLGITKQAAHKRWSRQPGVDGGQTSGARPGTGHGRQAA